MIVTLDVGGKIFRIASDKLLSEPGTYFISMLDKTDKRTMRDHNGSYFIDRGWEYFGRILNFMRTRVVNINGWTQDRLQDFMDEASFYNIIPLMTIVSAELELAELVSAKDAEAAEASREESRLVDERWRNLIRKVDEIDHELTGMCRALRSEVHDELVLIKHCVTETHSDLTKYITDQKSMHNKLCSINTVHHNYVQRVITERYRHKMNLNPKGG